jgi:hypothetical protein
MTTSTAVGFKGTEECSRYPAECFTESKSIPDARQSIIIGELGEVLLFFFKLGDTGEKVFT